MSDETTTTEAATSETAATEAPATTEAATESTSAPATTEAATATTEAGGDTTATAPDYSTLAVPEGVIADTAGLDSFRAFAAENAIDPALAQKLVDFQAGLSRDATEAHARTVAGWEQAARSDAEIGGAGFEAQLGAAKRALGTFATPAFTGLLDQTGLGNHPEMIRTLARIGRAMAEDGRVDGATAPAANPLAALYPTMISE